MTTKRTMGTNWSRIAVLLLLLLPVGAVGGCGSPDGPSEEKTDGTRLLRITLDISGTSIASVVAQASATDFDTITVNLQVAGDTASGTMEIPAGSNRVLTIRAYDAAGVATHRGQTTLTVNEGTNPAVTVVLHPLTGQQEIVAVVGQVFVTIVEAPDTMELGDSAVFRAIVTDVNGDTLTDRVRWASLTPGFAKVDTAGVVTALDSGQAWIAALYGQVGAQHAMMVLTTRQLVESRIKTTFMTWFNASYQYEGPGLFLSTASFQHSAPWTNAGMVQSSAIPRIPLINETTDQYYEHIRHAWDLSYRAIGAVVDGLADLDRLEATGVITPLEAQPYRAFGSFMEGMAYGTVAVLYDRGLIVQQPADSTLAALLDHATVMDTALAFLDRAIAVADTASFVMPMDWIPQSGGMSAAMLSRVAHSMKARFRAAVARDAAERAAVDWAAVLADVDSGVTEDLVLEMNWNWGLQADVVYYSTYQGWAEAAYWIVGMADQADNYQKWLAAGLDAMRPTLADSTDVLIVSPDLRFPRGATVADQQAAPGSLYKIPDPSVDDWSVSGMWAHPERGTWRWSYYWPYEYSDYALRMSPSHNEIDYAEMRLLKAEALYRAGDLAGAASLINVSRTANGLAATDAAGTNTDCVPRLPDGSCGDLFEMLKWEKRMQVRVEGLFGAPWYFDARGWGDLYQGTFLQLPVPCHQLLLLGESCYTFGGTNPSSAPVSTYAWPGEA